MSTKKFLDSSGLAHFWDKAKEYIGDNTIPKVDNASGNLAQIDSSGNVVDSGVTKSRFALSEQGIPTGGSQNQVLAKTGSGNYNVSWKTPSYSDLDSSSMPKINGVTLDGNKDSSTLGLASKEQGIPSGGSQNQVLAKTGSGNYNVSWKTPSYSDLDSSSKPKINGVSLDGNKDSSTLGLASKAQGEKADTIYSNYLKAGASSGDSSVTGFDPFIDTVHNKAQALSPAQQEQVRQNINAQQTITNVVAFSTEDASANFSGGTLTLGLPKGADAVNPFKGWYDSSSNLPSNPIIGDYAYVKGAESTDPAAIYKCTTDGSWSDSGRTADTSNVQTFASGEEVNGTKIAQAAGDSEKKLMSQKAVTDFVHNIQPQYIDEKTLLNKSGLPRTLIPSYINDKYISAEGVVTVHPNVGYGRIDCIAANEGDIVDMRFICHKANTNAFTTVRFAFFSSLPQTGDQGISNGYIEMPTPVGTYDMEKEFVAPITGYLGVSYNYIVSNPNTTNYITDASYHSYEQDGRYFIFDGKIGQLKEDAVNTLEDAYIDVSGVVTSYATAGMIQMDRIKVSAGDRVYFKCNFNKKESAEFVTCRYAFFDALPVIGSTCASNTLSFVPMPLDKGDHVVSTFIVAPMDGYIAISYKYSVSSTSNFSDVSYRVINYGSRVGKIASIGDSITYGYIPHGLTGNPDGQLKSYAQLAADILNMSLTNYGISGNYLIGNTAEKYAASMCSRFGNMDDDADIVTFTGGTNDIRGGVSLGTMDDRVIEGDTNTYTYYAGLHKLCEGLYRKYILNSSRRVMLIGITPPKMVQTPASAANGVATLYPNFDKWADAFKEVCAYYGIPLCDFFGSGLIAAQLASTWQNTAYSNTGYFNPLIPDGVHPSAIGQQYLGEYLVNFINSL